MSDMTVSIDADGGLARVTLANPPRNILTRATLADLREALERFAAEPALRALLLAAEGPNFSAGADVGEHLPPQHEALLGEFIQTIRAIDQFPLPVVAAVRGLCLGAGFELVLAADIVLAAESARFGQPEILLGVFPPAACAYLPEWLPRGAAAQLVFTGDAMDAAEARRLGLVLDVVPDPVLTEAALALTERITRHSAPAVRAAKAALGFGRAPRCGALRQAGRIYLDKLMRAEDPVEGLHAFLEKRTPAWSHR